MSHSNINEVGLGDVVGITGRQEAPVYATANPLVLGIKRSTWIQIGIIAVLFCALFWPNLRRLWDKTNPIYGEANWGHAMCIPFIGLYYLYVNRDKLLNPDPSPEASTLTKSWRVVAMVVLAVALPLYLVYLETSVFRPVAIAAALIAGTTLVASLTKSTRPLIDQLDQHSAGWFGGFIIFFGIAVFQYGIFPGQNDFVKDFGMVVTLFGVVLSLAGWGVMKIAWFPIAFLICGLPWPGLFYSQVAGPLQRLAANVAVWTLQLTGVEATVGGTKISMVGGNGSWRTLNVAEACAGMRSLMTFISVAAAVAFLSARPLWQKIIVVLFAVPIAISCNVMRVSGQGLLDRYVSHSLSENFAHQFVGLIMLIPAFLLILLVGWILDQIFVEQIDRRFVAHAPKVISRTAAPAPSAIASSSAAKRTLAEIRGNDPTPPALPAAEESSPTPSPAPVQPPAVAPLSNAPLPRPAIPRPPIQKPPLARTAAPEKSADSKPVVRILPPRPNTLRPNTPRPNSSGPMSSIVPPPPSIRLAPRSGNPRKRPGEGGTQEKSSPEIKPPSQPPEDK